MALILLLIACAAIPCVLWLRWSFVSEDVWSIDIWRGAGPLALRAPGERASPLITAAFVRDTVATFVADPFLLFAQQRWHLFFEVYEKSTRRGILACASSSDGRCWEYGRTVLREPFHLSYPQVFEADGRVWMVPESGSAGAVRLYRAETFPHEWRYVHDLVQGEFYDSTILRHEGNWWLFACDAEQSLRLFRADSLEGRWQEHPASPVVRRNPHLSRPAGRILQHDGRLLRFAQDGEPTYGANVRVLTITRLDRDFYEECELAESPLLEASGNGWNTDGMHHVDAQRLPDGEWIAAVDGNRRRTVWNWRAGARRLERRVRGAVLRSGTLDASISS